MSNLYYNPTDYGLTILAQVDLGYGYDYDLYVVFQDTRTGQLYTAHDSGCSCPSPFDGFGLPDLTPVTPHQAMQQLQDALATTDGSNHFQVSTMDAISAVRRAPLAITAQ